MLALDSEKALASGGAVRVAAPPGRASNFSGAEKSVVGAVTRATRAASSGVRGTTDGNESIAAAAGVAAKIPTSNGLNESPGSATWPHD